MGASARGGLRPPRRRGPRLAHHSRTERGGSYGVAQMAYDVLSQLPANASSSNPPAVTNVGAGAGAPLGRKSSTTTSPVAPFSSNPAPVSTLPPGQVVVTLRKSAELLALTAEART